MLLPSIFCGFGGIDRSLDLTIVHVTGHLCLIIFDFPVLNSLHFEYDLLLCVFNDGVFMPHRAFQLGLLWLV